MGEIRPTLPVKLFVGLLTSVPDAVAESEKRLVEFFGAADLRSEAYLFDQTHYYDEEMGTPIYRYFLSFEKLIDPAEIAAVKIATNNLEAAYAADHARLQRPINLDPGYLEQSKIVLASTKNFFHRIYVAQGIYAEVTLHFQEGAWQSFPWTFPDYKSVLYHPFFISLRNIYRNQLRHKGVRINTRLVRSEGINREAKEQKALADESQDNPLIRD
jgi:hypothetical protein